MDGKTQTTKERVLQAGTELFAERGFEGTSIREISRRAGVAVAAVNYHFQSKQALYQKVLLTTFEQLDEGIRRVEEKDLPPEESFEAMFEFMLGRSVHIKNTFKLFLSPQSGTSADLDDFWQGREYVGPPGGEAMFRVLQKHLGGEASGEKLHWAVRALFSVAVHWTLVSTTPQFKAMGKTNPMLSVPQMKRDFQATVKAILEHLSRSEAASV